MTVLLSGASGFLGTALAAALETRETRVVRLVRPGAASGADDDRARVGWDPVAGTVDRDGLEAAGPFEAAVHLSGAGVFDRRWTRARREVLLTSRTATTALLASTLPRLAQPPPVLVTASAIGYYGSRGDEELTETSTKGDGFLADLVAAWEVSAAPAEEAGLRVVRLRIGPVLSPDGGLLRRLLPLFRLGLGARVGPGTQYLSWITLPDLVAAVGHALADDRLRGPVNAVAPGPVTNAELTASLARAVGRPAFARIPAPVVEAALGREMAAQTALVSQRVRPDALLGAGFAFRSPTLGEAWTDLLSTG